MRGGSNKEALQVLGEEKSEVRSVSYLQRENNALVFSPGRKRKKGRER